MYDQKILDVAMGKIYEYEDIFQMLPDDVKRHSENVSVYASILYNKACELGYFQDKNDDSYDEYIDAKYEDIMPLVFKYHDLGKILVPQDILNADGILEINDLKVFREHSRNSNLLFQNAFRHRYDLKTNLDVLNLTYDASIGHHERWDGKGYPCGWQGKNTPTVARICAVADAYEAITSGRPYKESSSHNFAITEIVKNAGTQFDSQVVEILNTCAHSFEVALRLLKSKKEGTIVQ